MLIKKLFLPALLVACVWMTGCAAYPVVQIAGGAMTGYDAVMLVSEHAPKDHVEGGELTTNVDAMLERRLRERLTMQNINTVSVHVIERTAYLVGQFPAKEPAEHAKKVALSVNGLQTIVCKFYRQTTPKEAEADDLLAQRLSSDMVACNGLQGADLHVEVIRSDAILVGRVNQDTQRSEAVALAAGTGGIRTVVDYILVMPEAEPKQDSGQPNETVALN